MVAAPGRIMSTVALWLRAMAPLAAKLLKTDPCPYMVITECSATSFVWQGWNESQELHLACSIANCCSWVNRKWEECRISCHRSRMWDLNAKCLSLFSTVQPWKMKSPHWLLTTDPECAKLDSLETMPLVLSSPPSSVAPGIRLVQNKSIIKNVCLRLFWICCMAAANGFTCDQAPQAMIMDSSRHFLVHSCNGTTREGLIVLNLYIFLFFITNAWSSHDACLCRILKI